MAFDFYGGGSMSKPIVHIPWFPGTNCHEELAFAFRLAGAEPRVVLLQELIGKKLNLYECDLLGFAGGFSFGDHLRAGRIAALDLVCRFREQMQKAMDRQIPMIGICNGFQILTESGVLGGAVLGQPGIVLDLNSSARFEHRNNTLVQIATTDCVWTKGLHGQVLNFPVAHGEGRPLLFTQSTSFNADVQIAAYYCSSEGVPSDRYPASPNGSMVAAIATPTILGIMPHPERRIEEIKGGTYGLEIFRNGVAAVI